MQLAQQRQQATQTRFRNKVNEIPDIANGLGSVLEQVAIRDDGESNTGQATLAGALQGGSAGVGLGPLGIIGGALLGGVSGFSRANQSNADFYDDKALNEAFQLSAKTVSPSIFGKGGLIDGDEFVAVQMELDENYVTPDLNIYESKAKDKHEDMDDDFVSDVVRDKSFAFSNRKTFKPKTYADDILGYGFAHYSEDGNFALEQIKMKDVFGDSGKDTAFSDGARMIQRMFKVIREDDPDTDLLTQITNEENKVARAPYINKLIQIHEDDYDSSDSELIPQKFGKGGKMKKKKYNDGGVMALYDDVFSELESLENDNAYDFATTNRDSRALFDRMNTRSGIASIIDGLAIGLQSTRVDPRLTDTRFVDQIFEEVSPAIADQVSNQGIARANSLIGNIARDNPKLAERLAPRLFDSALTQSNASRLQFLQDGLTQRRSKYSFLNRVGNANRNARITADEATRSLINKKRTDLADVATKFLSRRDAVDQRRFNFDRSNAAQFDRNRLRILQNRLNATGQKGSFELRRGAQEDRLRSIEESLSEEQFQDYINSILDEPIVDIPIGVLS